jgi:UDP-N-acetylglucosamine 4,6-dehydratase
MGESLFLAANDTVDKLDGPLFITTRYGNVWNSTGSVVPRWREMIRNGAVSVPVSDPDCTRFFMRENEAVDLILKAIDELDLAFQEEPWRKLMIPQLPAYRIGDLATAMNVEMDIRGLPEFEKKHEIMEPGKSSADAPRLTVEYLREELSKLDT